MNVKPKQPHKFLTVQLSEQLYARLTNVALRIGKTRHSLVVGMIVEKVEDCERILGIQDTKVASPPQQEHVSGNGIRVTTSLETKKEVGILEEVSIASESISGRARQLRTIIGSKTR